MEIDVGKNESDQPPDTREHEREPSTLPRSVPNRRSHSCAPTTPGPGKHSGGPMFEDKDVAAATGLGSLHAAETAEHASEPISHFAFPTGLQKSLACPDP